MLHLVADIGGCQIVEQSFQIVANLYLQVRFSFGFPLGEVSLKKVRLEKFHKRHKFFLLIISGWFAGIHEDRRAHQGANYGIKGFWEIFIFDNDEKVEFDTFIVIRGGHKSDSTKQTTTILQIDFVIAPNAYIFEIGNVIPLESIYNNFDSEYLCLCDLK